MRLILLALLLLAGPLSARPKAPPTITLHCSNAELTGVLKKLAARMGRNIYIGPGVQGVVTADLRDVSAEHALGLVLHMQPREYRYKIVGNTVIVGTPEKMRQVPEEVLDR